ncbi:DNA-binding transcriptional regulator BolA-like [Tubulanus polymorphus]|uniref:DNA-binding transcriptional regulator BolA-like n=1 Tax=Tubulanus polymorphus TaxID=672921 RepID=UPI003DA1CCB7
MLKSLLRVVSSCRCRPNASTVTTNNTGIWSLQVIKREMSDLHKTTKTHGPIGMTVIQKLNQELQPQHLEVYNESYMHNVPKGAEKHFKVVIVSDKFKGQSLIKRHRQVNDILKEELSSAIHALSIIAKTPEQWNENHNVGKSPPCAGGAGK